MVVYPGTCRPVKPLFFHAHSFRGNENGGRKSLNANTAWRFRVEHDGADVAFTDEVMGLQRQNLRKEVGDFVVKRRDGLFAYQLANVVDDGLMGVTDVVRGSDLIDSTARQIVLFQSLGFPLPRFWHLPLMHDKNGLLMSKRDGSQSLEQLRGQFEKRHAESIVGELAFSIGLIDQNEDVSARELLNTLTPSVFLAKLINASKS